MSLERRPLLAESLLNAFFNLSKIKHCTAGFNGMSLNGLTCEGMKGCHLMSVVGCHGGGSLWL
jgi:hypothetical protein